MSSKAGNRADGMMDGGFHIPHSRFQKKAYIPFGIWNLKSGIGNFPIHWQ
jgi:hypothetical protein